MIIGLRIGILTTNLKCMQMEARHEHSAPARWCQNRNKRDHVSREDAAIMDACTTIARCPTNGLHGSILSSGWADATGSTLSLCQCRDCRLQSVAATRAGRRGVLPTLGRGSTWHAGDGHPKKRLALHAPSPRCSLWYYIIVRKCVCLCDGSLLPDVVARLNYSTITKEGRRINMLMLH